MLIIEPIITSLPNMCVTVLATLAITLIFKTSYTTNFAQGVISALGCYVVSDLFFMAGWKIYFGLPVGILAGIAAGLFIDIVIFRRGKNVNAILLVEHDMGLVMDICDTVCAISFGKLLCIGTPEVVQADKNVQTAYLGVGEE